MIFPSFVKLCYDCCLRVISSTFVVAVFRCRCCCRFCCLSLWFLLVIVVVIVVVVAISNCVMIAAYFPRLPHHRLSLSFVVVVVVVIVIVCHCCLSLLFVVVIVCHRFFRYRCSCRLKLLHNSQGYLIIHNFCVTIVACALDLTFKYNFSHDIYGIQYLQVISNT